MVLIQTWNLFKLFKLFKLENSISSYCLSILPMSVLLFYVSVKGLTKKYLRKD